MATNPQIQLRVQQVLRDVVQDNKDGIEYRMLIARVRDRTLRSSSTAYSYFRQNILETVVHMADAGYITINTQDHSRLTITPDGRTFFAAVVDPPKRSRNNSPKSRPSRKKEVLAEYGAIASSLVAIREICANYVPAQADTYPVDDLSSDVARWLAIARNLRDSNSEMSTKLDDLNHELDAMETELQLVQGGAA